jgi:hypothetical protein
MKKTLFVLFALFLILFGIITPASSTCDTSWTKVLRCIDNSLYSTVQWCCSRGRCYTQGIGCGGPTDHYDCTSGNILYMGCPYGCHDSGNWAYCNSQPTCSSWSTWSSCNSTGQQMRSRECPSTENEVRSCSYLNLPFFATLLEPNIPIHSTDLGDTVLLRFSGVNLNQGNITYSLQVLNSSGTVWYNPFTWFGGNSRWNSFWLISGSPSQLFTVTSPRNHRINASIESENIFKISNPISVSPSSSARPTAVILSPSNFFKGSTNYPIYFDQASIDEDDLLEIRWSFGDTISKTYYNYSKGINQTSANTFHSYTLGGKFYTITLTAKEMTREGIDQNHTEVYIFGEGINIFPVISSPSLNSVQGNEVWYNASQSYIVNCTRGLTLISVTDGFNIGNLTCRYILAPGAKDPLSGSVQIRWREIDSEGNTIVPSGWIRGNDTHGENWTSSNYNRSVVFPEVYETPRFRRIRMDIIYINS